ncbi:hypothetical protein [Lactiplantibacillus carotarum]|uniref:hypothetical protein n=1 Tax=Lactiplantibacillus carotarum TaxID=2993456 RepID=UPI00298F263D|nr:hypothetical protein [Lactiplantibacillus carotarum]
MGIAQLDSRLGRTLPAVRAVLIGLERGGHSFETSVGFGWLKTVSTTSRPNPRRPDGWKVYADFESSRTSPYFKIHEWMQKRARQNWQAHSS